MTQQKTEWTPQQRVYILWLAMPRGDRDPPKQQGLAEQLGVSRHTLLQWKKKPGFQDAVFAETRCRLDWRLSEILAALGKKAESGDVPAVKMVLELTGRHKVGLTLTHEMREYGGDKLKEIWAELKRFEEQLYSGYEPGDEPAAADEPAGGIEADSRPEG